LKKSIQRIIDSPLPALILAAVGALIGVAWTTLATYLGSLVHASNPQAMMSIRAVFVVIALFVHGYVRSSTPRLYLLVLLMIFPVLIGLVHPLHPPVDSYVGMRETKSIHLIFTIVNPPIVDLALIRSIANVP
jgi:RsiW-degrading membrane proteinase PrsW (M82 family)